MPKQHTEPDANQPDPERITNWCQSLVNTIRHGGIWGIPRSGLVFRIDKEKKRLVLTDGDASNEDFTATRHEFAKIGWDVVTADTAT
jgi:hypothetical protein